MPRSLDLRQGDVEAAVDHCGLDVTVQPRRQSQCAFKPAVGEFEAVDRAAAEAVWKRPRPGDCKPITFNFNADRRGIYARHCDDDADR